jgi:hypothetical protein
MYMTVFTYGAPVLRIRIGTIPIFFFPVPDPKFFSWNLIRPITADYLKTQLQYEVFTVHLRGTATLTRYSTFTPKR